MVRLFIRHKVRDFDFWLKAYSSTPKFREEGGVVAHSVHRSISTPDDVTVVHDFEDVEKARAFAQNPALGEIMVKIGVQGEVAIWLTETI
ncbi:MAG: cyclase [Pseudomonadota bacterium]